MARLEFGGGAMLSPLPAVLVTSASGGAENVFTVHGQALSAPARRGFISPCGPKGIPTGLSSKAANSA